MKAHAVIFDLDGTLLDTLGDIAHAMNAALSKMGFQGHPLDAYRYFVGSGMPMLARRALPPDRRDDQTVAAALLTMREEYAASWDRTTRPYPGIPEMLDTLSGAGVRIAVLSNKPDDFTKMCVKRMLPGSSFSFVAGVTDMLPPKPDPSAALRILAGMGVRADSAAFVGDTPIDMETALAAGMFPIGVTWGFRPESELVENGAKLLARSAGEIPGLVGVDLQPG